MGLLHNELRRTKLSEALTRAMGASKGSTGLERYGETLTPVIDLWSVPEWAYLRQELLWTSTRQQQAAVVGEFSMVAVCNNTNGQLVIVEQVSGHNIVAASSLFIAMTSRANAIATLAAPGVPAFALDFRKSVNVTTPFGVPVEVLIGSDPGVIGNPIDQLFFVDATFRQFVSLPVILKPGTALIAQSAAANQGIDIVMVGRVRAALPGELD